MDVLLIVGTIFTIITVPIGAIGVYYQVKQFRQAQLAPKETTEIEKKRLETELHLQERRDEAENAGQQAELSSINLALADVYRAKGELEKAEFHYRIAISYYLTVNDTENLARARVGLLTIYTAKGEHDTAISLAKEVAETVADNDLSAEIKLRIGICYRRTGRFLQALQELDQCIQMFDATGNRTMVGEALIARGDVHRKLERFQEAEQDFRASIQGLRNELQHNPNSEQPRIHLGQAMHALGRIYLLQERYQEAEELLKESVKILEEAGNFYGIEMSTQLLGRLFGQKRRWREARRWYNESFVATAVTGNNLRRIETLFLLAELAHMTGARSRAQALASSSVESVQSKDYPNQLARLYTLLGHISLETHILNEAIDAYEDAITVAVQGGPMLVEEVFSRLNKKLVNMGNQGQRQPATTIIEELITWWSGASIDGRPAELVEDEQISATTGIERKPVRVSEHLRLLHGAIAG